MTETNSGKVITIISGDLAALTRPLVFIPMVIAAPFVNLTAYAVLWKTSGIEFAFYTFCWWIFLLIGQHFTTEKQKTFKAKESGYNDERQKLVADMVTGAKTIKAYAWENHYIKKITSARKGQVRYVFAQMMIEAIGLAFFSNGGLIVLNNIFLMQWARGELLDPGVSMSLMAMIFYVFFGINMCVFMGLTVY